MQEVTFGEVLRQLRRRSGLSQEMAADGICTTSTFSRMENDSQMPSPDVFRLLMERLNGHGYSYGDVFMGKSVEAVRLRQEVLMAMTFGNLNLATDLLCKMKDMVPSNDSDDQEFLDLMIFLWERQEIYRMKDLSEHFLKRTDQAFVQKCKILLQDKHIGLSLEEIYSSIPATQTELILLNNLAIALHHLGEVEEAILLWNRLLETIQDRFISTKRRYLSLAGLQNNLALAAASLGQCNLSLEFLDKAFYNASYGDSTYFSLLILKTRMTIYQTMLYKKEFLEEMRRISFIYQLLPPNLVGGQSLQDFLERDAFISIL